MSFASLHGLVAWQAPNWGFCTALSRVIDSNCSVGTKHEWQSGPELVFSTIQITN